MIIVACLLSAVSVIYGSRSRTRVMGQTQNVCPQCKKKGVQTVVRSRRWFTLYFIPLIPLSKKTIARCNLCGFQYAMDNKQADSLFSQGQAVAQPQAAPTQPQQIMEQGLSSYLEDNKQITE